MKAIVKTIIFTLFLPIVLCRDIYRSQRSGLRKIGYFILVLIFLGLTWLNGYGEVKFLATAYLYDFGITDKLIKVQTRGPSMLPTIQDGAEITLNSPKKFGLKHGDIVSFRNVETGGLHYLKRIIGLPGEQISIKNGFVTINGKILQEDYTLNNLLTFGNTFLIDCEIYTIPEDHFVVMGDNRTVSWDSRAVGFVDKNDIDGVMKTDVQEAFVSEARQNQILKANIDENIFREKINAVRMKNGAGSLSINNVLNEVAKTRAEVVRDSLGDWKNKLPPLDKALGEKNYKYNSAHEFLTFGYLDEEGLVGQILESPPDKMAFLSNNYLEMGLSIVEKENKGCMFPVISVIISWPVTPTYSQEIIDFWQREEKYTKDLMSILQTLTGNPDYDQSELRQLLNSLVESANIATQINQKINAKEWIDYQQADRYFQLAQENKLRLENEKIAAYLKNNYPAFAQEQGQGGYPNPEFSNLTHQTQYLFGSGRYDDALKTAQQALMLAKTDKEKAIAHYWIGLMYYRKNDPQRSESELKLTLELNPNYAASYVTLAAISMDKNDYPQALAYAQKAVELDPQYAWGYNGLGLALVGLGRKEEGINALKKAVELAPDSYIFRDNLTRVQQSN